METCLDCNDMAQSEQTLGTSHSLLQKAVEHFAFSESKTQLNGKYRISCVQWVMSKIPMQKACSIVGNNLFHQKGIREFD